MTFFLYCVLEMKMKRCP